VQLLAVASDVYAGYADLAGPTSFAETYRDVVDARLETARNAVDRALEACEDVPASGDVRLGDAAHELTALSGDCDLLVLGSRRWGPIRRLALGSTSEQVIRQAACPVLVPPRGAATEHGETDEAGYTTVVF
jgi:nucleotide-binding universal stress UspA family protein